jgi:hypothetical protein
MYVTGEALAKENAKFVHHTEVLKVRQEMTQFAKSADVTKVLNHFKEALE